MELTRRDFVTQNEFARRFNVNPQSIYNAVLNNKFTDLITQDGRILLDWPVHSRQYLQFAKRKFINNVDTGYYRPVPDYYDRGVLTKAENKFIKERSPVTIRNTLNRVQQEESPSPAVDEAEMNLQGDTPASTLTLTEARRNREFYAAKRERLRYEELAGILLRADEVRVEWQYIALNLQKSMLAIPDRVCSIISGETQRILQEFVNKILDEHEIKAVVNFEDYGFDSTRIRELLEEEIRYSLENAIPDEEELNVLNPSRPREIDEDDTEEPTEEIDS